MAYEDFSSTGWAYDDCQVRDDLPTGTIFTVEAEQVVGIAWAWPVAVTKAYGDLHYAESDPRTWEDKAYGADPVIAAVDEALELARSKGWEVADWAQKKAE